jgi:hypothetical protein
MKRFLIACCLLLASFGCSPVVDCEETHGAKSCPRILFIGNSYTFANDLPGMFAGLAKAGGHNVETGMAAQGGWSLSDYVNSSKTIDKINSSK